MKITFTIDTEADGWDLVATYQFAPQYRAAIEDIDGWLRAELKYNELNEATAEEFVRLRAAIRESLDGAPI